MVALLAIAAFLYGIWSWTSSYQGGQNLARRIQSEQITDPERIWSEWTELSHGDSSSFTLRGTRNLVKQKLRESAERTIAAYRASDGQPVPEKDWQRARNMLVRAMSLDPDDTVRGDLRLAEGHIARIEGGLHKDPARLRDAIEEFERSGAPAAQIARSRTGPGPRLPFRHARYRQGFPALDEAGKRGYPPGNREKLQLAYAYMVRADREFWDSRDVRGLPQEKDQVSVPPTDYQRAVSLYQSVAPYGNANAMIKRWATAWTASTSASPRSRKPPGWRTMNRALRPRRLLWRTHSGPREVRARPLASPRRGSKFRAGIMRDVDEHAARTSACATLRSS